MMSMMRCAAGPLLCWLACLASGVRAAGRELPDELTVNVGEVKNVGTDVTVVLRKHSVRAPNYLCGFETDAGFKSVVFPVSTYRGHVQGDPLMYVNGNIEPGGIINLNFTENRMIIGRVRDLKIEVPGGKSTATMSTGNKIVPVAALPQRTVPTRGGYLIPEVPMRQSRWRISIAPTYTEQFDLEKVVSQVEQRWNDADFVFARDAGIAWEVETILVDPQRTKGVDWNAVAAVDPGVRTAAKFGNTTGLPGRNNGKWDGLNVSDIFHEAAILLHEGAHLYDNPWHQLDVNDGLCGGGAYWAYNNVAVLVENRKARHNETNFPGVVYGSPLPPHAMYDFAHTRPDTPVTIDVLENDYSGNGHPLTLRAVQSPSDKGGTVTVAADGKAVYTPAPGFLGLDRFHYTVEDSAGLGNRSGQVKVDVRAAGLAIHYDFEQAEAARVEDRRQARPLDATLWFYDTYDRRPPAERLLHHFRNLGPYDTGSGEAEWLRPDALRSLRGRGVQEANPPSYEKGRGTAHWIRYAPVEGVRGKGIRSLGQHPWEHVKLGDGGDPGRESLSASVWVLYPPGAGGDTILCKGGEPFPFVNGWSISGGAIGGTFTFSGNVGRLLEKEAFVLQSEETIQPDAWYHLVMVMDRENKRLRAWVNNKEVKPEAQVRIPDGVIEHFGPLHVFNRYTGKWWTANRALVDEVKIYTSALTPEQVAALYAEGKDAAVPRLPDPQ